MAQLPGPGERAIGDPISRLLFSWESHSCSLRALTGEAATFTRSATGTALDDKGTSRTLVNDQPRWQWEDTDADTVRDTPFLLLGQSTGAEHCRWTLAHRPSLSITILVDFIEGGARTTVSAGVLNIGNDAGSNPRLYISTDGTFYHAGHHNGTSSVTSAMSAGQPAVGDRVRLRVEYNGGTGTVRLYQTINTGAEGAAVISAGLAPATAWSSPSRLALGSQGSGNQGANRFRRCKLAYGGAVALTSLEGVR